MKNLLFPLSIVVGLAIDFADAEPKAVPSRESIEWCDIWISHANETNLPRVLLIGDSITRDYYPEAEKRLERKASLPALPLLAS